jgi:hypothetical protein
MDRELIIGQALFVPGVNSNAEQTVKIDRIEFKSGPGTGINGEYLWDATWISRLLLSATISTTEKPTVADPKV